MGKNIGKNLSKNLRGKYRRKRFYHGKQSATDVLKTSSKNNSKNSRSSWWFDC